MKTTTSHRRISAHSLKTSRISRDGNGELRAKRSAVAPSLRVANWLARPKQNLIGSKWVSAESRKRFDVFNPADASIIARVPDSAKEDIDRAVKVARRAFEADPWRRMTPSERGKLIWRIGDLILEYADELAEIESLDNGKPRAVARVADLPLAADLFITWPVGPPRPKGKLFRSAFRTRRAHGSMLSHCANLLVSSARSFRGISRY